MRKTFVSAVLVLLGGACLALPAAGQMAADMLRQAEELQRRGQLREAVPMANQAYQMAEQPNVKAGAKLLIGECLREQGQMGQAIAAWREVIQLVPNTLQAARAQYEVADTLRRQGRAEQAIQEFEEVRKTYPWTPEFQDTYIALGDIYLELGEFDRAITAYRQFVDKYSVLVATGEALAGLGRCYQTQGQFQQALAIYERLARKYPLSKAVQTGFVDIAAGECLAGLRRFREAVNAFRRVARTRPEMPRVADALRGASDAMVRAGDKAGAIGVLQELASRYPNTLVSLEAQETIAQLHAEQKNFPAALSILGQLESRYGKTPEGLRIRERRADMLVSANRPDQAIRLYTAIARAAPRTALAPRSQLAMAECYARGGDLNRAQRALEQVGSTYANSPYATTAQQMMQKLAELAQKKQ